jgi:hypothetical protein
LILLKNRSIKFRARYRYELKQIGFLRFRFGGMFAHAALLAGEFPDPIRVVSAIREQHRLRKQGAEKNRAQPIIVRLTGREGEMDGQAIGINHRVNLAR